MGPHASTAIWSPRRDFVSGLVTHTNGLGSAFHASIQARRSASNSATLRCAERRSLRSELGPLHLAAQDLELVAEYGDLDVLGVLASQASRQHAEESARHAEADAGQRARRHVRRRPDQLALVQPRPQRTVVVEDVRAVVGDEGRCAGAGPTPEGAALLRDLAPYVGRICGSIALDDGDDAMQETMIRVLKGIHSLRNPAALRGWVRRIAVREATKLARARRP